MITKNPRFSNFKSDFFPIEKVFRRFSKLQQIYLFNCLLVTPTVWLSRPTGEANGPPLCTTTEDQPVQGYLWTTNWTSLLDSAPRPLQLTPTGRESQNSPTGKRPSPREGQSAKKTKSTKGEKPNQCKTQHEGGTAVENSKGARCDLKHILQF